MKFVSFLNNNNEERLGILVGKDILDLAQSGMQISLDIPSTIIEFLQDADENHALAIAVEHAYREKKINKTVGKVKLLAPVPHPPSCRDAYAFRQHVATARKNRGVDMIPEFDQFPVFYFTNHHAIIGEGALIVEQDHLQKLDFELEAAIVIGKKGKNIPALEADDYIFGYTIMNDFSARQLQMEEMRLNLGPAKGKDFATALGPWLVTVDELAEYKISTPQGDKYNLQMRAFHNGQLISKGNLKDMNWTFAEIIERASYGVDLYPGDVIGSGTVGTGCFLEINGTRRREAEEDGESYQSVWLKEGDEIELEITGLGNLIHRVLASDSDYSILAKKKKLK